MKKIIFLFLLLVNISYGQQSLVHYNIKERSTNKTGVLYFNKNESFYVYKSAQNPDVNNFSSNNQIIDNAMKEVEKTEIKKNIQKAFLKRNLNNLKEGVHYVESLTPNKYSVNDNQANQIWKLTNEQKTINSIVCKKAETEFRGRSYTAWYATNIPTKAGPWKFAGLPGLIVSISSNDGLYQFELSKIEAVKVKPSFTTYTLGNDVISFDNYISKVDEYFQKKANKIYSETSKGFMNKFLGAKTSPVKMDMKNIEMDLEKVYESKTVD